MPLDLEGTETILTITQTAEYLSHLTGQRHEPRRVHSWIRRGVRGVQLEAIAVGGTLYTSREAIQRFISATTTNGVQSHARSRSSEDE